MTRGDAYANGPYIPGAAEYPLRWAAAAQAFRDGLGDRALVGLAYGSGARQAFDLFLPEGDSLGTVVFVHGGFWRAFGRADWSHLAEGALGRGWAMAIPEYDLCPAVRIHEITRQVSRAVQAIADRTDGPLALAGHSAGGHLVARMLDPDVLPRPVAERLTAVMPISPLADLRPLLQTDMNADFRLDAAEAAAESPVLMADWYAVPVSVVVGASERPAFLDQAAWLSRAWGTDLQVLAGRHHFDVIECLQDPASDQVAQLTTG
ncbi:MAG: alpha/beta hydrolase [Rhodobacteraceae bacterium]|nr:alpha/beta hydrolase [Paracoccaceae bacterium]